MTLILSVLAVFALLVGFELWWRRHRIHGEFSRKFIHIVVGSFVAFWPFFLPWWQVIALSAAFIVVVVISKYFGIFQAIHTVERPTWGEIFFALAVGLLAVYTHEPLVYAAALLHMGLADGLAAVVGVRWGGTNQYLVLGHRKSWVGSATFFVVSLLILAGYSQLAAGPLTLGMIAGIAMVTTAIENLGVRGIDNLLVPLVVAFALSGTV